MFWTIRNYATHITYKLCGFYSKSNFWNLINGFFSFKNDYLNLGFFKIFDKKIARKKMEQKIYEFKLVYILFFFKYNTQSFIYIYIYMFVKYD